jgi:hypothetical protein
VTSDFISLLSLSRVSSKPKKLTEWEPDGKLIHLRPDQIVMIEPLEPENYKISLRSGAGRFVAIDDDTLNDKILIGSSPSLSSDVCPSRENKKDVLRAIELGMRHWHRLTCNPDPDFREPLSEVYATLETVYHEAAKLRAECGLLAFSWDAVDAKVKRLIASGYAEADPTDYVNGRLDLHEVRLTKLGFRFLGRKRI